jgi:hypothetical protein
MTVVRHKEVRILPSPQNLLAHILAELAHNRLNWLINEPQISGD